MDSEVDPTTIGRGMLALSLLPFIVAFCWLIAEFFWPSDVGFGSFLVSPFLMLAYPVIGAVVAILARRRSRGDASTARSLLLFFCLMAPLGVIPSWVVVPSHLGITSGTLGFFMRWLTRYPNFGPVNYEVLLGILCVLGSGAIPAFFGVLCLTKRERSWVLLGFMLVLQLLAYVPVLIQLDWDQAFYTFTILRWGPLTLFTGPGEYPIAGRLLYAPVFGAGVFIRMLATAAMASLLVLSLRGRPKELRKGDELSSRVAVR